MAILFMGCTPQPKPTSYFPVMNLTTTSHFSNQIQTKQKRNNRYYHQRAHKLLKDSGYFRHLASYSPYTLAIEYKQHNHTSLLEVFGKSLNPIHALVGINIECSVEMKVSTVYRNRVIENYHYEHHFRSSVDSIPHQTKRYFDTFIERLIEDMLKRSQLKRTRH
jgi:hypothetical protein